MTTLDMLMVLAGLMDGAVYRNEMLLPHAVVRREDEGGLSYHRRMNYLVRCECARRLASKLEAL